MAIKLEANYSKKLGLPNYSSHQYSVTVRTEVSDLSQVEAASAQLYQQLQEAVDRDIQNPGYLPGTDSKPAQNSSFQRGGVGTSQASRSPANPDVEWKCSIKQRGLIEKLMKEHNLPFEEVDELSHFRFKTGLKQLNKMSASGLIDELINTHQSKSQSGNSTRGRR
ncbi:MAG: hypothetical protein ACSHX8_07050 [Opitutaceae bacterium]